MDPRELSAIRRTLLEYNEPGGHGAMSYAIALRCGVQRLRPDGSMDDAADSLARQEWIRLNQARLYFVDSDMCALVQSAHPEMPEFSIRPSMLPSSHGLVVFGDPIAVVTADSDDEVERGHDIVRKMLHYEITDRPDIDRVIRAPAMITGASWGPNPYIVENDQAPYGSLWITFYADNPCEHHTIDLGNDGTAVVKLPPMIPENDAVLMWGPPQHVTDMDETRFHLPADPQYTSSWARIMFATFLLAAQRSIASVDRIRLPRAERRRCQRQGVPDGDVQVMTLRHRIREDLDLEERMAAEAAEHPAEATRSGPSCRFLVRGHTRWQHYPKDNEHRPIWISPYVKGPDGAPFRTPERVRVVRRPRNPAS